MHYISTASAGTRAKLLGRVFSVILASYVVSTGIASAETFTVSTEGELNAALLISATNQQDDVIDLDGSIIELTDTIEVTSERVYTLTIQDGTIRPASDDASFRLLKIGGDNAAMFILSSMTFENGRFETDPELPIEAGGAAVYSAGVTVVISESTFSNNIIEGNGAGGAVMVANSHLLIELSTFENNQANSTGSGALTSGGAIATVNGGFMYVHGSTFTGNSAIRGGAIAPVNPSGTTEILESTFSNNNAETFGGVIWARSKVEIALSTFYNNNADTGGGVLYFQPVDTNDTGSFLIRNTLVGNTGGNAGNALRFETRLNALGLAANLIIGNNIDGTLNCAETGTSGDNLFAFQHNNISDDISCGTATYIENGADLFTLGTPQDNGGPTATIALQPGSLAIDNGGAPGEVGCTLSEDQRGVDVIDNCEVGSFEFEIIAFDMDEDGILDDIDNCPATRNPNQADFDEDGTGDACDDTDLDGVNDDLDNCPIVANAGQANLDGDGFGDVCDVDIDGDGVNNDLDAFPLDDSETVDTDGDGEGNRSDADDDGDLQSDVHELQCGSDPLDVGSISADADQDGIPDCADLDGDNDGIADDTDNCPEIANPGQEDANENGVGDACDTVSEIEPVTVYKHVNFRGSFLSVGEGEVSFSELRASSVGNDRISSIEIAPGYEVYACQHGGFRGRCETFTGTVSDLRGIGFNDVISSLRVSKATILPVTVYQHVNFRGNSYSVGEGDVSIGDIRASNVGNDQISSIEIAEGYEVYACQHWRFRGRCETFTGSVSDLRGIRFNDVISSLRVQQN